jgi:diaminopropionate ammonia-lyase
MYRHNTLPNYRHPLLEQDARALNTSGTDRAQEILALREGNHETPLIKLNGLAKDLGVGALYVKDEGKRLGLGSFKALGGAYALMVLVLEEAERQLGRTVATHELFSEPVLTIARQLTFTCATDGNHGRSVAQGAKMVGAKAVIFVHAGVSEGRIAAIARFGAAMVRVPGNYDDSVAEAARVAAQQDWTVVSDTSWPGYEHIPALVMQGYTIMVREILRAMERQPTHVFLQAGVGGFAAAVAGHLALVLRNDRPHVTIVEPARAACIYDSVEAGQLIKVAESQPTVMAMLECYEPSMIAFRVLERVADGFMTVEEDDAVDVMKILASPVAGDAPVVSGESGGAGLAGVIAVLRDRDLATTIGLGPSSRVLVINTEGATDPALYQKIVGRTPEAVLSGDRT